MEERKPEEDGTDGNTHNEARINKDVKESSVFSGHKRTKDKLEGHNGDGTGENNGKSSVTRTIHDEKTESMIDKVEELIKEMNMLTVHQAEGINALEANEWKRFPCPLIIDSGAAETVLPSSWFANYRMRQSAGSLAGVFYQTANGESIYNEGEKTLMMVNEGDR